MRTIDVDGVRVAYRESGYPDGRLLVLLHGGASGASTWQRFALEHVAFGGRVVAADLRGHGASGRTGEYPLTGFRDDIVGLLDTLDVADLALVGHSLGAYTALLVARERPKLVSRLVLEEPPSPPRVALEPLVVPRRRMVLTALGSMLRRRRFEPRAVVSAIAQLREPDEAWWDALPTVTVPTLILGGGPTSHLTQASLAEIAAAMPHARLATIPAGHRIHSRRPSEFATTVFSFLTAPQDCSDG